MLTFALRPVSIAPIRVETEEEKSIFEKGEQNYRSKKALRANSLLEQTPNDEESDLIHSMWKMDIAYQSICDVQTHPSRIGDANIW